MSENELRCSTPCDDDCEAVCHEDHVPGHKKAHWPYDCPAAERYGWGGSDFIAAAVKRLRGERDAATERAEQAEARAQYLDEEALRLQRAIDEARKQRDDWQQAFGTAYARAEQAEAVATHLRGEVRVLTGECESLRGTLDHIRGELHAEKAHAEDAVAILHAELNHMHERNREWRARADQAEAALAEMRDLLGCISLYVKWRYVTKQLTTPQKDMWASAVDEWSARLNDGVENPVADRWWSDADGRTALERAADEQGDGEGGGA